MNTLPYRKLPALTSLRFFAAAAIVVYHSQSHFKLGELAPSYVLGHAVSFFYVLSGFILAYTYPQLNGQEERKRFIVARIARVWPMHALGVFLVYALSGWILVTEPRTLVLNLALLHAWTPDFALIFSWNEVSWSVSVEFGLYILFLWLIHNWGQTWRWKLAAAFGVICVIAYHLNRTLPPVGECTPDQLQASYTTMCQHVLPRVFEFALGMTGPLLWRVIVGRYKVGLWLGTAIELGALGLVGVQMYYLLSLYGFVFSLGGVPGTQWWITSGCCFSLYVLVVVMACEWGWVSRLLALRPMVFLGEISFAVYILHPILYRCIYRWPETFANLSRSELVTCYAIALLAGSSLAWFCYERPARVIIRRLYDRWANAGKVAADTPAVPAAPATESETRRAA